MATTSAWAVGSFVEVTWLNPSPTTRPSRTTTAPKGPPRPSSSPCRESAMARRMKSLSSIGIPLPCSGLHKGGDVSVQPVEEHAPLRLPEEARLQAVAGQEQGRVPVEPERVEDLDEVPVHVPAEVGGVVGMHAGDDPGLEQAPQPVMGEPVVDAEADVGERADRERDALARQPGH